MDSSHVHPNNLIHLPAIGLEILRSALFRSAITMLVFTVRSIAITSN